MVVLSYEGNAVAWIDETYALVVSTMTSMGTWSAPVKIKQFTNDPYLNSMAFSAGGSRLIWARWDVEGVFLTQTTPTGWSPADYVVVDDVTAAALSPNGSTIVWGNDSNQVLLVQFKDGAWKKAKVLGSSSRPSLAVANKTVAWTSRAYAATTLRTSVRTKGKWSSAVRLASQAFSPAVSFNSRTVAWADPNNKQLLSVKR